MYNSFISLGWFCGTAASMSRYGLRSFSSPFDWCYTNFESVIHFIETDFNDFLAKDNLQVIKEKPKEFTDIKYDLYFNHEVKSDFEIEYHDIYNKYQRRIKKFREEIKKEICFIRAVHNEEELSFIINNEQYINRVIKKHNINCDIIYLIPKYMKLPEDSSAKWYIIDIDRYRGNTPDELKTLFDTNSDLISFCQNNFNSIPQKDNIIFDLQKEISFLQNRNQILKVRYNVLAKLAKTDFSKIKLPSVITIYGAGDNGKFFYDNVKEKCTVKCFIDTNPLQETYDDILIIKPSSYTHMKETIIITPIFALEEISTTLEKVYGIDKSKIESLENFI